MYGIESMVGKAYFSDALENKVTNSKPQKRKMWRDFCVLKRIAKDSAFDGIVNEHIIKDKTIKSGTPIIKGTRISTCDIMKMTTYFNNVEDISDNFPSITNEKQILAAIVYEVRNMSYLKNLFGILFKN